MEKLLIAKTIDIEVKVKLKVKVSIGADLLVLEYLNPNESIGQIQKQFFKQIDQKIKGVRCQTTTLSSGEIFCPNRIEYEQL